MMAGRGFDHSCMCCAPKWPAHHPLAADTELAHPIAMLAGAQQHAIRERTRSHNKLQLEAPQDKRVGDGAEVSAVANGAPYVGRFVSYAQTGTPRTPSPTASASTTRTFDPIQPDGTCTHGWGVMFVSPM